MSPSASIRTRLVSGISDTVEDARALWRARRRHRRPRDTEPGTRILRGLAAQELMYRFENLGNNCEFGLVQRGCGAEPLGLFRFASTSAESVTRALEVGLADLAEPEAIRIELEQSAETRKQYIAYNQQYDIRFHTGFSTDQGSPEKIHREIVRRTRFLARKLSSIVCAGSKILVFRSRGDDDVVALRMGAALARLGPNLLLWVTHARSRSAVGRVEPLADGILKGQIEPDSDWDNLALETWLTLCERAYGHWSPSSSGNVARSD